MNSMGPCWFVLESVVAPAPRDTGTEGESRLGERIWLVDSGRQLNWTLPPFTSLLLHFAFETPLLSCLHLQFCFPDVNIRTTRGGKEGESLYSVHTKWGDRNPEGGGTETWGRIEAQRKRNPEKSR